MNKDIYFSHDAHARNDIKIKLLLKKYGYIAYGWYWAIIEELRKQDNNAYEIDDDSIEILSDELKIDDINILHDFLEFCYNKKLLKHDDVYFWSESLNKRMDKMKEISKKRSESAKAKHQKQIDDANAEQMQNNCTEIKENEIKLNETKENEIINENEIPFMKENIRRKNEDNKVRLITDVEVYSKEVIK